MGDDTLADMMHEAEMDALLGSGPLSVGFETGEG